MPDNKELQLTPMECLQARLDYAHHVTKKANKKGSHADDEAICQAQLAKVLSYLPSDKELREEIKKILERLRRLDEIDATSYQAGVNNESNLTESIKSFESLILLREQAVRKEEREKKI